MKTLKCAIILITSCTANSNFAAAASAANQKAQTATTTTATASAAASGSVTSAIASTSKSSATLSTTTAPESIKITYFVDNAVHEIAFTPEATVGSAHRYAQGTWGDPEKADSVKLKFLADQKKQLDNATLLSALPVDTYFIVEKQ